MASDKTIRRLRTGDLDLLPDRGESDKRLLSQLTGLSYHLDETVAARALTAFGRVSARLAHNDPEAVRIHLRRLFWLMNDDSGGFCPSAPEMIAEAIACSPGVFDEFISPLVYLLGMEAEDAGRFRPAILRAIARIGVGRPAVRRFVQTLAAAIPSEAGEGSSGLIAEV